MSNSQTTDISTIVYMDADEAIKERVKSKWGEKAAGHMHLVDGFSIVAFDQDLLIGLISVYGKKLPLLETYDWFIDILEVHNEYRRKGIASHLMQMVCERARGANIYQIRSGARRINLRRSPWGRHSGLACVQQLLTRREKK